MEKRVTCMIVIMLLGAYIMSGCTPKIKESTELGQENLTIVTSFYPIYLHVLNITKDIPEIEVINMTQPQTGCLHDYQLTPNDLKTLDRADIFVINGGGMESFIDKAVSQLPKLAVIDASEKIDFIHEDDHDENGHSNEEDGHDHDVNPHVWVSVTGAINQVAQITERLGSLDPNHKKEYDDNGNAYIEKLEALSSEMHAVLDHMSNKNIVTFHEAFPYFAQEFGLNIIGTIVTEPGSEPSAKDLEKIIEDIEKNDVKAVFAEPQYESKAADVIAKEAGVKLYTLDPVVTGESSQDQINQYLIIMRENLKTLEEALR